MRLSNKNIKTALINAEIIKTAVPGIKELLNSVLSIASNINIKSMLQGNVTSKVANPQNASCLALCHINMSVAITIKR